MKSKRDVLVDTALRLFYTQGFNATGIDKILAESGVAKMTMYKHFKSKDELILAALTQRDEQFRDWLTSEMQKAGPNPREQLLAMYDALEDWFKGNAFKGMGFSGCAFINASSEFAKLDHPPIRSRLNTNSVSSTISQISVQRPVQQIPNSWPNSSPC